MPEVVWVYFWRSLGQGYFLQGTVSVQMIGYNTENGATCFLNLPILLEILFKQRICHLIKMDY